MPRGKAARRPPPHATLSTCHVGRDSGTRLSTLPGFSSYTLLECPHASLHRPCNCHCQGVVQPRPIPTYPDQSPLYPNTPCHFPPPRGNVQGSHATRQAKAGMPLLQGFAWGAKEMARHAANSPRASPFGPVHAHRQAVGVGPAFGSGQEGATCSFTPKPLLSKQRPVTRARVSRSRLDIS